MPHSQNIQPTAACPTDDELRAVLEDAAGPALLDRLGAHLETCRPCRERLERLAGADNVLPAAPLPAPPHASHALSALMRRLADLGPDGAIASGSPWAANLGLLEPPVTPGTLGRFAGYDILERVAEGGMGIVLKARDLVLGRTVALKILAPALATSASARARFLREARAAAAVDHEHVVAIHAVGEERGFPFLVMAFIQGTTLGARLGGGPLDPPTLLRIGRQISLGLAAAHAQGLVHRDIKPGNILLENGVERVKITDFGLARAVDEPGVTRAGVLAGTPEFMSPEQARGEPIDARSDLFSLGAVLYTMATGRSPFLADSTSATLRRVCDVDPAAVRTVNPGVPASLESLIHRLLAKDRAKRPDSAGAVAEELRHLLDPLHAERPVPPSKSHGIPARRMSRWVGGLVALALALAFVLIWQARRSAQNTLQDAASTRPSPAGTNAPAYRVFASGGSSTDHLTLEAAIAAAPAQGVIELTFSGAVDCEPVVILGKQLTLRAAPGTRPILIQRAPEFPLIRSEGSLTLQGLEIRAARGDSDTAPPWPAHLSTRRFVASRMRERAVPRSLIVVREGILKISHCRLVAASRRESSGDVLSLHGTADAEVHCSEIYNGAGAGVFWRRLRPGDALSLSLSNSLLYSFQPFLVTDTTPGRCELRVSRSTVVGEHLVAMSLPTDARATVTESVLGLRGFRNPYAEGRETTRWELRESANTLVAFSSDSNFPPPAGSRSESTLALDFRFRERLETLARPTRPLRPADFAPNDQDLGSFPPDQAAAARRHGATAAQVGPGQAWDRFRQALEPPPRSGP